MVTYGEQIMSNMLFMVYLQSQKKVQQRPSKISLNIIIAQIFLASRKTYILELSDLWIQNFSPHTPYAEVGQLLVKVSNKFMFNLSMKLSDIVEKHIPVKTLSHLKRSRKQKNKRQIT